MSFALVYFIRNTIMYNDLSLNGQASQRASFLSTVLRACYVRLFHVCIWCMWTLKFTIIDIPIPKVLSIGHRSWHGKSSLLPSVRNVVLAREIFSRTHWCVHIFSAWNIHLQMNIERMVNNINKKHAVGISHEIPVQMQWDCFAAKRIMATQIWLVLLVFVKVSVCLSLNYHSISGATNIRASANVLIIFPHSKCGMSVLQHWFCRYNCSQHKQENVERFRTWG